jgi:hypothetical protein
LARKPYQAGVIAVVYGIIEEPALGWSDASVLGRLISGGILLAGFC